MSDGNCIKSDEEFINFVENSKKVHGWERIQWKIVAREYLEKCNNTTDKNTKDFQKSLKNRFNKFNKSNVVVTGTKSTQEQIAERQAAAISNGTLIDLTQEKVNVVDSKGKALKMGDVVRYVGDDADVQEENGEEMEGTITEIKEDGTVMGTWKETGNEIHEFDPSDIEKVEVSSAKKSSNVNTLKNRFRQFVLN